MTVALEAYLKPGKTFTKEIFVSIVNGLKLNYFCKKTSP